MFLSVSEGFLLLLWCKHQETILVAHGHHVYLWLTVLLNKESLSTTDIWHEILSIYNQLFPKLIYGFIEYFVLLFCMTQSTLHGVLNPFSWFRDLRFLFLLFPQRNYSFLASVSLDVLPCTWLRHSKALLLVFLFLVGI